MSEYNSFRGPWTMSADGTGGVTGSATPTTDSLSAAYAYAQSVGYLASILRTDETTNESKFWECKLRQDDGLKTGYGVTPMDAVNAAIAAPWEDQQILITDEQADNALENVMDELA